ncbi:tetratricopeptide repeat protein [Occallatibacter savannae]|uniref:tetratricopeptide repeat protein n=1 Tax=Occallatibacter savannae TaxID=1002691 RepID=UPI000D695AC1|nr:tetratricopeptide repeat protein [Occallatibacter savannae]
MQAISLQRQWTNKQALLLVSACLAFGIAGGWFTRGFQKTSDPPVAQPRAAVTKSASSATSQASPSTAAPLKEMADKQAASLLAKLNADPTDPDTLSSIGNLYYDAQQYTIAIDYYNRALQSRPSDASVRTDMATAWWYLGNADEAIAQFNRALADAPTNPNTLFNLGLVKWQGKHDGAAAIALWKKLLASNPNYEQKDKVLQMLSDVEKQIGSTKR